jgi:predicted nucleic acid-binding protein
LLEIDTSVAIEAILIRQRTRLKLPDAIILATARVHGLLLVTRNSRDFPRGEPDIRIPY